MKPERRLLVSKMKKTPNADQGKQNCPNCADGAFNEFLQDIENDIRMEKYNRLWQKYRVWIIGAGVGIFGSLAVYTMWQHHENGRYNKTSMHFIQAQNLEHQGRLADAAAIFSAIAHDAPKSYRSLAAFAQAGLLGRIGGAENKEKQIALYKDLCDKDSLPPYMRQLAGVYWVDASLAQAGQVLEKDKAQEWLKMLKKVQKKSDPEDGGLGLYATELRGVIYFRLGKTKKAQKMFRSLGQQSKTPAAMRLRTDIMLQAIQDKLAATPKA